MRASGFRCCSLTPLTLPATRPWPAAATGPPAKRPVWGMSGSGCRTLLAQIKELTFRFRCSELASFGKLRVADARSLQPFLRLPRAPIQLRTFADGASRELVSGLKVTSRPLQSATLANTCPEAPEGGLGQIRWFLSGPLECLALPKMFL